MTRIAVLIFDGFTEIDSFVALHVLNRMRADGWHAQITGPMNTQAHSKRRPMPTSSFSEAASGDEARRGIQLFVKRSSWILPYSSSRAQCSGTLLMAT
jgi:hypothetical protein